MSEELLNIVKELSEKPTTELALQFMELTADNIIKDKEIDRLNKLLDETRLSELHKEYIINELEKWCNNGIKNGIHIAYEQELDYEDVLDKLKELKENNK